MYNLSRHHLTQVVKLYYEWQWEKLKSHVTWKDAQGQCSHFFNIPAEDTETESTHQTNPNWEAIDKIITNYSNAEVKKIKTEGLFRWKTKEIGKLSAASNYKLNCFVEKTFLEQVMELEMDLRIRWKNISVLISWYWLLICCYIIEGKSLFIGVTQLRYLRVIMLSVWQTNFQIIL